MSMKGIKRLSHTMSDLMRSSTLLFDISRVVEELVHNSVDAGSTKVVISLSIRACYVKVEDDGCGITRDGLVILGGRYATSKVHLVADAATSTETLGVRGEALSSLSDISLLEIRSKVRGKPNAYCKIIKSSKCLFFGIDDQREDVGTTVIVRDLFYNQPIRRKFMQSSVRKVLHSVKKCVFRIALVHPKVSFKVIDLEGEEKLLCTIPSPSSLPLLTDGFGNEVSSLLHKIVYSDRVLALSGYISGPTDAFLKKAFQYIYINSRFVCKGPIHNLINGLATTFQSTIAKWRDNSENYCRKRQKTKGYPAYFLNLCCPMSSYDLSFEPSKTVVEFKDWGTILSFFEQAIMTFWKQLASHLLQGETSVCRASFHESGTSGKEISEIKTMKNKVLFHQDSTSCSRITNPLDTSSGDGNNYQKHNHSCDDQAVSFTQHKRCQSKDNLIDSANFFKHEVKSFHGTTNYVRSRYMNSKSFGINDFSPCLSKDSFSSDCILGEMPHENYPTRSKLLKEESMQSSGTFEPLGIGGDICHFPVGYDSDPSKTYMEKPWFMENEEVAAASCSTSYSFGDNLDFLKELFSHEEECTTGANQYNKCLNVSNNFSSTKNTSIGLLQGRINSDRHMNGFIRKCQTSKAEDAPLSCASSPFFHDRTCLTEQTILCHGKVAEPLEADSKLGSSWHFAYPGQLLARTSPRVQDFMHDSTLLENHVCSTVAGYRHYAIEEKNAEFLDAVLNDCSEVLPDVNCTPNTILDHRFCPSYSNHLQCDYHSDELMPEKDSSTVLLNEEKSCLRSESSSLRHAEIYDNTFLNLAKQNNDDSVEMSSKNKKFKNSLPSDVQKSRLQRSHSAPPFYKRKKKFPILNCLPTDCARDSSTMNSSQEPHGLLETYSASQPYIKPITELLQPCSRESIYEKPNQSIMIELQSCEKFGSVPDELDLASASLTKWRTGSLQPPFQHVIDMPHISLENNGDVLDISSGLLHLAGSSLVPESINKDCLDDAKVLLQLDRKFIPVVASGTLVIIDQHAADERIRLEELRKKVLNGELSSITQLNTEHELILPEMWYQMLQKYAEQIKKWGWICNFHNQCLESFARNMNLLRQHKCRATLVAVPHILGINLTDKDLLEYIDQLVETDGSSIIPPSVIRILNFKACRGAIMFGDALLPSECSLIVEELKATSLCFQCAHGRPTTVPLLNMASLHQHLARLDMLMSGQQQHEWHGLRRHTPSIQRAQHRLELSKRFLHGR